MGGSEPPATNGQKAGFDRECTRHSQPFGSGEHIEQNFIQRQRGYKKPVNPLSSFIVNELMKIVTSFFSW